jgi:predicted metal-binding protein
VHISPAFCEIEWLCFAVACRFGSCDSCIVCARRLGVAEVRHSQMCTVGMHVKSLVVSSVEHVKGQVVPVLN